MKKYGVGNTQIIPLSDGRLIFDRDSFFNDQEDSDWEPYPDYHSASFDLNIGCLVIQTTNRCILVDTGLGQLDHGLIQPLGQTLLKELHVAGLDPADIDIVFITHLHIDHVGTNMTETDSKWIPTFPNATYMAPAADWKLFSKMIDKKPFSYLKQQILPLLESSLLELFEGQKKLSPEVKTLPTPGHTPGHTSLLIESNREKAIVIGDAIHIPPQLNEPHWSPRVDRNKELSAKTRQQLVRTIEEEKASIVAGHFPAPGIGKFKTINSKRTYLPF